MNRFRKIMAVGACVALSAGLNVVLGSGTAHAATPKCSTVRIKYLSSGSRYYVKLPATSSTFNCYMNWGTTGERVKALQRALRACGYGPEDPTLGPLYIDGDYGAITTSWVRRVQVTEFPQDSSEWDGVYGPRTSANMGWPVYGGGENGTSCTGSRP